MQTVTFEPLRWQDAATRVTIELRNGHPQAYFQVTAPDEVQAMAIGRPVEELPRILAILGPAHHIAAARALDRLFEVVSPEPAENMRRALLQTYIFIEHLKKISFLLLSLTDPFADLRIVKKSERIIHGLFNDVMHATALAQEAAGILGGRSRHPLTAVAGGISRYLKNDTFARLTDIAAACLSAAKRTATALNGTVLRADGPVAALHEVAVGRMPYLTVAAANSETPDDSVCLKEDGDNALAHYRAEEISANIGIQKEPWTYAPFAFIKTRGWHGLAADNTEGLYFVGPLARLNAGQTLDSPLGEEERIRMIDTLGPPPHFDVMAAYRALLVEMLAAAECMSDMFVEEKFVGPVIRTIPSGLGTEGYACVEAPQGLIFHRYRVDPNGIVNEAEVLNTTAQNNALFCLLTQKAVEVSRQQKKSWKATRTAIELSLLPF